MQIGHVGFRKMLLVPSLVVSALAIAEPAAAEINGPDVSSWQHPNGSSIKISAPASSTPIDRRATITEPPVWRAAASACPRAHTPRSESDGCATAAPYAARWST